MQFEELVKICAALPAKLSIPTKLNVENVNKLIAIALESCTTQNAYALDKSTICVNRIDISTKE